MVWCEIADACAMINVECMLPHSFVWDNKNSMYTDGELEYQLRGHTNGEFEQLDSILVRFCENKTHDYCEFFTQCYSDLSDLLYDALSDETVERLIEKENKRLKKVN